MVKYMFDTNIFNHILDGAIDFQIFENTRKYCVTHIQIDELNNTKDNKRKSNLLNVFQKVVSSKIGTESAVSDISHYDEAKWSSEKTVEPTESFVLDVSRLGMAKLSDSNLYDTLLKELTVVKPKPKDHIGNMKDALIAETCIKNSFVLVTDDGPLYKSAKKHGCVVNTLDQFLKDKILNPEE